MTYAIGALALLVVLAMTFPASGTPGGGTPPPTAPWSFCSARARRVQTLTVVPPRPWWSANVCSCSTRGRESSSSGRGRASDRRPRGRVHHAPSHRSHPRLPGPHLHLLGLWAGARRCKPSGHPGCARWPTTWPRPTQRTFGSRTEGLEHETPNAWKVDVRETRGGAVYDSGGVRITAFPVPHGNWPVALGYRIDTPDRSVVISGQHALQRRGRKAGGGCRRAGSRGVRRFGRGARAAIRRR